MDSELTDDQLDEIADQVADRLPTGRYGDRVILTRRQAMTLAGSGLSLAALGFGSGTAAAADGTNDTSVGDVGASGDSVDVYVDQLRDPGGDVWLNVDGTGYIDAQPRKWVFGDLDATNFSFSGDLGMGGNDIDNAGVVNADSASVTNQVDAGSVDTGEATINGLPGVPLADEESGSPYVAEGSNSSNSITADNLDPFDMYYVLAKFSDKASSGNDITLQIDGVTNDNYFEVQNDGTENTPLTEIGDVGKLAGGTDSSIIFSLTQRQSSFAVRVLSGGDGSAIMSGGLFTSDWPPSQFTLKRGADTDWRVRVWGRNV